MKTFFVSVALCLASGVASASGSFAQCPQFFAQNAAPKAPSSAELKLRPLCYDAFAVMHSGRSKTPLYVAERLSRAQLIDARDETRTNRFFSDARLPRAERAELDDYKGNEGIDRGHMSPAADQPTAQAMSQSFTLANVVPQYSQNNRKAWASIEKATRKYAMRAAGDVYVITGPVFDGSVRTIGSGKVWVPTYLYKLVYDPSTNRAWAHWIENSDAARPGKPISYGELVKRTGIEFLPGVQPAS